MFYRLSALVWSDVYWSRIRDDDAVDRPVLYRGRAGQVLGRIGLAVLALPQDGLRVSVAAGYSPSPRAGFAVQAPSLELTDDGSEIAVRFHYPPNSEVRVTLTLSSYATANLNVSTLLFTPTQHGNQVVLIQSAAFSNNDAGVKLTLETVSDDPVFHGLKDTWEFTAGPKNITDATCDSGEAGGATSETGCSPVKHGCVRTYECAAGTSANGGSVARTCLNDGQWSGSPLQCTQGEMGNGTGNPAGPEEEEEETDTSTATNATTNLPAVMLLLVFALLM